MSAIGWRLVDAVSLVLGRDEREAARGDLAEARVTAGRGLAEVIGLILWREAAAWKSWRPWIAAFGLALPASLLLMGFSLTVSWTFERVVAAKLLQADKLATNPGALLLLGQGLLLVGWSWTSGFVVGSMSRRTLWASVFSVCSPCLFCLLRFREPALPRVCLLLFLLPAIWGVRRGARLTRLKLSSAMVVAVGVTALMIPAWASKGPAILNWSVIWPAWYMVATAENTTRETGRI
jgi:hypothetical protein